MNDDLVSKTTHHDPLKQTKLYSLMNISSGKPEIRLGIIDGPLDFGHPAFQSSRMKTVTDSQLAACRSANSGACLHGTFVAGILSAKRGFHAPAICPGCELILRPIFGETSNGDEIDALSPCCTPEELSTAIIETVNAGAKVINLSIGLSTSSLVKYRELEDAYDFALRQGVIIVIAAGNQGNIGNISVLNHPWIIPVCACDEYGILDPISNFGSLIGSRGLLSPGVNVKSTSPGRKYIYLSGTSVAAPFVTGAIALLWSIFPKSTVSDIVHSVKTSKINRHRRSIIPPLLDCQTAFDILKIKYPSAPDLSFIDIE